MEPIKRSSQKKILKILEQAFLLLKRKNHLISQRSLAKKIGVSSSYLSKIFRGERLISSSLVSNLIDALKIDQIQAAELQKLVLQRIEHEQISPYTGISIFSDSLEKPNISEYGNLGQSEFWLLEEWHIIPLLNLLTTIDGHKSTPSQLANKLNLPEQTIKHTLSLLEKAGYLNKNDRNQLVRTKLKLRFPTSQSHQSIRKFHSSMIKLALQEIQREPLPQEFHNRLISGLSVASDPQKIKEARLILEEAMYKAAEVLASGKPQNVCQINVQFFKISK